MQRARDRRRRHRERVDLEPQLAQQLLLAHAEALLLVDDDQPELLRDDVAREQAVRADQHLDLALAELAQRLLDVAGLAHARDGLDAHREVAEAVAERLQVLLHEQRRRRQHEHLASRDRDQERGAHRHLGLAEADVAADQAVHRLLAGEILVDLVDGARLILGLGVRRTRAPCARASPPRRRRAGACASGARRRGAAARPPARAPRRGRASAACARPCRRASRARAGGRRRRCSATAWRAGRAGRRACPRP